MAHLAEMHRTLRIPEIVDSVFSHLDPTPGKEGRELAALARTCTMFHDIALDALWWHQESIINLIRCMPTELWEIVIVGVNLTGFGLRPTWVRARI